MEGFHVKVSEAICLGASLAASGLLYYHYKKSKRTFEKLDVGLESVKKLFIPRPILVCFLSCSIFKPKKGNRFVASF